MPHTAMKVVDTDGNDLQLSKSDHVLAWKHDTSKGHIIAFRKNDKDVDALIDELKKQGETDADLLDKQHWMAYSGLCNSTQYPSCGGSCSGGYFCSPYINGSLHGCYCVKR